MQQSQRLVVNDSAGDFDPYYTWLGIPPARQPPNHYQLLGIIDFEQNPDVIANAADRQMTHLRSFALGPNSAFSQQLLNEVTSARICLLNVTKKAIYDKSLRLSEAPVQESQPPVPSPGAFDVPRLPSELPAPFAVPVTHEAPPKMLPVGANSSQSEAPLSRNIPIRRGSRHRASAQNKSVRQAISIVVGGLMGCIIGWFIVFVYLPKLEERKTQARRSGGVRNSAPAPQAPRITPPLQRIEPRVPRPTAKLPQESSLDPKAAPNTDPSRPPFKTDSSPTPKSSRAETPEAERDPAPSLDLSSLPTDVNLPPISTRQTEPLNLTVSPEDLEIEFVSDLIAMDSAYAFVANKESDSEPPRWQIDLRKEFGAETEQAAVANLTLLDNRLSFRWTDGATAQSAGQLRNCLMRLKSGSGSHQLALRSPLRPRATPLPPERDKFRATFDLEDLPRPEALRLDVNVSYNGSRVAARSGTETTTPGKRLDFKIDELQNVEIQVVLLSPRDSSLTLQALPRQQLSGSRHLTLSTEEVDELEQRMRQSFVKTQRDLAKSQNALAIASNALSRASDSATRAKFGAIVATQTKAVAIKQKSLIEIQQALGSFDDLRSLVAAVRSNTLIRYRIYAESNESRLLLVDGEYDGAEP